MARIAKLAFLISLVAGAGYLTNEALREAFHLTDAKITGTKSPEETEVGMPPVIEDHCELEVTLIDPEELVLEDLLREAANTGQPLHQDPPDVDEWKRRLNELSERFNKSLKKSERRTLRLIGHTYAKFKPTLRTEAVHVSQGTGCQGCAGRECVQVTGTLVVTCTVTTKVKLPRVSDFPNLRPCQQERLQKAIEKVLAPHEKQHVDALHTYDGSIRRAFDLNLCRSRLKSNINETREIRQMAVAEEQARRRAAKKASRALDPFDVHVDLKCK
jgi:hypothetical protein